MRYKIKAKDDETIFKYIRDNNLRGTIICESVYCGSTTIYLINRNGESEHCLSGYSYIGTRFKESFIDDIEVSSKKLAKLNEILISI